MDHYFRMEHFQTARDPMLEGYSVLNFVAILGRVNPDGDVSEFLSDLEQYAALGVSLVEVAPLPPDPAGSSPPSARTSSPG